MKHKICNQIKINIGCGLTPTAGFVNFDNSFSLRLSKLPFFCSLLFKLKIIDTRQMNYINFCQKTNIKWADATKNIPFTDNSVSLVYCSHMLEHLHKDEAISFLLEVLRVLKPGGILRLAVPDILIAIENYKQHKDADAFIESIFLCAPKPISFSQRFRLMFFGNRHHLWMYDGKSLSELLKKCGFHNITILPSGETTINDYGTLDLNERSDESVYVEGVKI